MQYDPDFAFRIHPKSDPNNDFFIDKDGNLHVNKQLDWHTTSTYNLSIQVQDGLCWNSSHFDFITLGIRVIPSVISRHFNTEDLNQQFFVSENAKIGEIVGKIELENIVYDRENADIICEIEDYGNSAKYLQLNPVTGEIVLSHQLDFEHMKQVYMHVMVKVVGEEVEEVQIAVIVNVLDEDDNDFELKFLDHPINLFEDVTVGTFVAQLNISDADSGHNAKTFCQIVEGDRERRFYLDSVTNIITVQRALDYEAKSEYELAISCQDFGRKWKEKQGILKIKIFDVNDEPPVFERGNVFNIDIMENLDVSSPVFIDYIKAIDSEKGSNGEISYILHSQTDFFTLNSTTGALYLTKNLSAIKTTVIPLTIQAVDRGEFALSSTATVNIHVFPSKNLRKCQFPAKIYRKFEENREINGSLVTISPIRECGDVVYSLKTFYDDFRINSTTGELSFIGKFDAEVRNTFEIDIEAIEITEFINYPNKISLILTVVDVNDNPPEILTKDFDIYIPNTTSSNQILYVINAQDPDFSSFGKLSYQVLGEAAKTFTIDKFGGLRSIERELNEAKYELTILVRDQDGLNSTVAINFYTANAEKFVVEKNIKLHELQVTENSKDDLEFGLQAYFHEDLNDLEISIMAGNRLSFYIDDDKDFVVKELDREQYPYHRIFLRVCNKKTPAFGSVIEMNVEVLDENDNAPIFEKEIYYLKITENTLPSAPLLHLTASDADSGENAQFTFTISNLDENYVTPFAIHPQNGYLILRAALDREEKSSYLLEIECVDDGNPPQKGRTMVFVTVEDQNDNPPRFSSLLKAEVLENQPIADVFYTVKATDLDENMDGIKYEIVAGKYSDYFELNSTSGEMKLKKQLDREEMDEIDLQISCHDDEWQVTTQMTVKILDYNDNPPVFSNSSYFFTANQTAAIGEVVGNVTASDEDLEQNSVISYFLNESNEYLRVDVATGKLVIIKKLDGLKTDQMEMTVKARDHGYPSMESEAKIVVRIQRTEKESKKIYDDIRLELPRIQTKSNLTYISTIEDANQPVSMPANFISDKFKLKLSHRTTNGTLIGQLQTTQVSANKPRILLQKQDYLNLQGEYNDVRVVKNPKRPVDFYAIIEQRSYEVLPSITHVYVEANNERATPVFKQSEYALKVRETAEIGYEIVDFELNLPSNSVMSIVKGNDRHNFCIKGSSILSICHPLKAHVQRQYNLQLVIFTNNIIASRAMINVTVVDVDNHPPRIREGFEFFRILENLQPHSTIGKMLISDADRPESPQKFSFEILTENSDIAIDNDGVILSTKKFDRELKSMLRYDVRVSDMAGNSAISTIYIVIEDQIDNLATNNAVNYHYSDVDLPKNTWLPNLQPASQDSAIHKAICNEISTEKIMVFNNCSAIFNGLGERSERLKMSANVTNDKMVNYTIKLEVYRPIHGYDSNLDAIAVEMVGTENGVAQFFRMLMKLNEEVKLRFISSSLLSPFRHKIILSMEDPNGTLPTTTAAKFVEDFYHKHASKLSVYDLKARINLCISDCLNGGKCKATTTNKRNIYRNFDFVVHVRNVVWKCNCPTPTSDEFCGNSCDSDATICSNDRVAAAVTSASHPTRLQFNEDPTEDKFYSFTYGSSIHLSNITHINQFEMTFATDVADGVLACFYDDTRVDKAFLTIDVANGNLRIFGKEIEEKKSVDFVNDGKWHKITLKHFDGKLNFTIAQCVESDVCNSTAFESFSWPSLGLANFKSLFIGGLGNSSFLDAHQQVASAPDFHGCMANLKVDQKSVEMSRGGFTATNLLTRCYVVAENKAAFEDHCGNGKAIKFYGEDYCVCEDNVVGNSCNYDDTTISDKLLYLKLIPTEQFKRTIHFQPKNSTAIVNSISLPSKRLQRRAADKTSGEEIENQPEDDYNVVEFYLRTFSTNTRLVSITFPSLTLELYRINTTIKLKIEERLKNVEVIEFEDRYDFSLWTRITLGFNDYGQIMLKVGEDFKTIEKTNLKRSMALTKLSSIEIGSLANTSSPNASLDGCIRRLTFNGQLQITNSKKQILMGNQFFHTNFPKRSPKLGCLKAALCQPHQPCPFNEAVTVFALTVRTWIVILSGFITTSSLAIILLGIFRKRQRTKKVAKNCQRISNMKLISTCGRPGCKDLACRYDFQRPFQQSYEPGFADPYGSQSVSNEDASCSCDLQDFISNPSVTYHSNYMNVQSLSSFQPPPTYDYPTRAASADYAKPISILYSPRMEVGYVLSDEDDLNTSAETAFYHEVDYATPTRNFQQNYV